MVVGGSLVIGGVVAMQGLAFVARYGASEIYGWAAAISSFRDVGPLLLGFMLAARLGTKNAAELATLAARERIDALTVLGLDARRVVVLPRLWAITGATLLFYPLSATGILASAFVVARLVGQQSISGSWFSFITYLSSKIIVQGLLRQASFGFLIGVASCRAGMAPAARGAAKDARAIGSAVFASSVACMCGIVVVNLYLSFIGGTE